MSTSPSRIGNINANRHNTEESEPDQEHRIIGKHGIAHEKISKEKTQKNIVHVSDQIKQ